MAKKKQIFNYFFESSASGGAFIKICNDMIKSSAWQDLSLKQRGLYLEFKGKFTKYKKTQDTNVDNISMPYSEYSKLYGDKRTFWIDIDKLIDNGFIKVIEHGWTTRTANIYGFSDRWKHYGEKDFAIPNDEKRHKRKKDFG